jgi:hypothetical protein
LARRPMIIIIIKIMTRYFIIPVSRNLFCPPVSGNQTDDF